jgi:predicted Fe-Mo cluster-binding NifX family protein
MNSSLLLAVPSDNPGGLTANISGHFGHCDLFTLISVQEGKIAAVDTVGNVEHSAGGCLAPVSMLQDKGVGAIVVGGMGARPMQAFAEAGIAVYYADRAALENVGAAADGFLAGKFPQMRPEQTCQGHDGNCHGH